jgi:hypothetical protein
MIRWTIAGTDRIAATTLPDPDRAGNVEVVAASSQTQRRGRRVSARP